MILGLLGLVARAHVPHDEVVAVAAPAALDAERPWWMVLRPHQLPLLMKSEDGGLSWTFAARAPLADELLAAAGDEELLALLGEAALWWSEDGGETWSARALPEGGASALALDDGIWIAGDGGLWTASAPGADWELVSAGPVRDLRPGPGGLARVDVGGEVWAREGGGWVSWGAPLTDARVALATVKDIYVGASSGEIWRRGREEGDWAACASLEEPAVGWPAVVQLAASERGLWVATGGGGPWLSRDDCESWLPSAARIDPEVGGSGSAEDAEAVATALLASGDRVFVAGWAGAALSEDAGASWSAPALLGPAYTRGLAASVEPGLGVRVWTGAYAAGVVRSDDGGLSLEPPGPGQRAENIQRVALRPGAPEQVWAVADRDLQLSLDGGDSWEAVPMPFEDVLAFVPLAERVGVVGHDGGGDYELAWTEDEGASWAVDEALGALFEGSAARGAATLGGTLCLLGANPSRVVCEQEGAWTLVFEGEGEGAVGPALAGDGLKYLVFADDQGVYWSADLRSWEQAAPLAADAPTTLAGGPDGALLMSTRTGALLESADHGERWEDLGVQLPAPAFEALVLSGLEGDPGLLLATPDGVYWVSPLEPGLATLARWSGIERVESSSDFVDCAGCSTARAEGLGLGSAARLGAGAELRATLRGSAISVLGLIEGSSLVTVTLDGAVVGEIAGAGLALEDGPLWSVDGLDEGWHELALLGVEGEGVLVDAVQSRLGGVALAPAGEGDSAETGAPAGETGGGAKEDPSCGCAGAGRGSALGVVVVFHLLGSRRRRP